MPRLNPETAKYFLERRTKRETELQRSQRLEKQALRQAYYRRHETMEQRQIRLHLQSIRQARYRLQETPEQRQTRLKKQSIRQAMYRLQETSEQRQIRLQKNAARQARYRLKESAERNRVCLQVQPIRQSKHRQQETTEPYEARLPDPSFIHLQTGQGPSSQGYSAQQVNTLGVWNSPATASSVNFMRRQQQPPPQNSMLQPTAAKLRRNQGKQFVNQHINIKNREPKTILHTVEPTLSSFTKTQEDLQTESKASILAQPVRQKENVLVFDEQEAVAKANSPDEGSQPREKEIYVVANHQHCIMSNLTFLWKNGKLCDAGISNGSTTVKVHKLILSAMCPKLLSVFNAEKFSKEFLMVNFPKEVSKEALKAFAEYMYEGILNLDCHILEQLKIIAKKLDMREFEQLCNSHLSSYIHIPDALSSSIPFTETTVQVADMFSSPTSIGSAIQDSAYSTASQIINIKQEITEAELDQVMKETAVVFGSDTNRTSVISDESINTDGIRISPNIKMEPVGSEDDKYGHLDPNNSNHGFTSTISSPPSVPAIKSTLTASIPESSLKFTIPFSHTTDLLENSVKLKTTPSYQENSLVSDFSSTPIIFNAASSQSNTLDKKNLSKSLNQPSDSSSSVELSLKSNGNHNTVYPVKLFTVKGDNLPLNKNN